jgi:hypothetical protein
MNEFEVENAARRVDATETPVLADAIGVLERLVEWTNRNSDGWPYWTKPANAASRLQDLIQGAQGKPWDSAADITPDQLRKALSPIKAFFTRQKMDGSFVLDQPA